MFRFIDPVHGTPFWITPGGGLNEGENHAEAAARELKEETGIKARDVGPLGPCVWTRTVDIRYGHKVFRQHERYFKLQIDADRPDIDTAGMLDYETSDLREHRWWTPEEIAVSDERFAPSRLAALLQSLQDAGPQGPPIDVGR